MKGYRILLLSSFIFICSFLVTNKVNAEEYSYCNDYNHNFTSSDSGTLIGTALNTSGSIIQTDSGYIDCTSYREPFFDWIGSVSLDRVHFSFTNSKAIDNGDSLGYYVINSITNSYILGGSNSGLINGDVSGYADGSYYLVIYVDGYDNQNRVHIFPFWVKSGKVYLSIGDIPTASSGLEPAVGSLNFGLAIVIVLLSLSGIFSTYNLFFNRKKPYQK